MGLMKELYTLRVHGAGKGFVKLSKDSFFDSARVAKAVGVARRPVLSRQGALIRGIARRSMRRRKGPSKPGIAPHAHAGQLKDFLFFGWDPQTTTVVVGPARYKRGIVPRLMEEGGVATVTRFVHGNWTLREKLRGRREVARSYQARYPARPYMGPALEAARPKLAEAWRDRVGNVHAAEPLVATVRTV